LVGAADAVEPEPDADSAAGQVVAGGNGAIQDLCMIAGDPALLGAFWAAVLGRTWEAGDNGEGLLSGPAPQHTI
jgi:hypothetical protein